MLFPHHFYFYFAPLFTRVCGETVETPRGAGQTGSIPGPRREEAYLKQYVDRLTGESVMRQKRS
jgi:hypothetical protein